MAEAGALYVMQGPEDRRRGAGYIAGDYSNPKGLTPDVHYSKGLLCTDCHNTPATDKKLLHGQVRRQASCSKCHDSAVKATAKSVHKRSRAKRATYRMSEVTQAHSGVPARLQG